MDDWPPILFVSGSEGFLRRRLVAEVIEEAQSSGRVVEHVDGSVDNAVADAISGNVLMEAKTLVVVSNPEKVDLELIQEHNAGGDSTYILLLHVEGNVDARTKFGKLVKKLGNQHRAFPSPKSWEADTAAVDFVVEEAKTRFRKAIGKKTAQALVSVVGPDLGILHYELLKASTLAEAQKSSTIEIPHVKGSIAPLAEADVFPAIRALEDRNLKRVIRCLDRIKKTARSDPTMKVCRIMGATVTRWVQAAALDDQGYEPDESATMLGINPWFYKRKVLPTAQRWKQDGVLRLVHALAQSERAILNGHVDPWTGLVTRLISAFEGSA